MSQFFSFSGRVRRMTFWINTLICGAASFLLDMAFVDLEYSLWEGQQYVVSNKPIYYGAMLLIVIRMLSIYARRWHDLDKSALLSLLAFYPVLTALFPNLMFYSDFGMFLTFVGIISLLVSVGFLGFVPGDVEANEYGPEPVLGQMI